MSQDTIGDMLTRIRNAVDARHHYVMLPYTKMNHVLCGLLKQQGFVRELELEPAPALVKPRRASRAKSRSRSPESTATVIVLRLKYHGRYQRPVIHGLARISAPSLRSYSRAEQLPRIFNGMGTVFVSTSAGVMTDRAARRRKLGGEVLCSVW